MLEIKKNLSCFIQKAYQSEIKEIEKRLQEDANKRVYEFELKIKELTASNKLLNDAFEELDEKWQNLNNLYKINGYQVLMSDLCKELYTCKNKLAKLVEHSIFIHEGKDVTSIASSIYHLSSNSCKFIFNLIDSRSLIFNFKSIFKCHIKYCQVY